MAVPVQKKLVEIDEEVLAQATEILGGSTVKDTVNQALAEVVRLSQRRAHALRLAGMAGLDLDDGDAMARACSQTVDSIAFRSRISSWRPRLKLRT